MESLNAVVVGVGSMGKNHARNYFEMDGVELVGVCDAQKKVADSVAGRFKCESYPDHKKLLKDYDIDIASIVVPTQYHRKVAVDFIKAGVHLLVEKPIAETVAEGEKIIEAIVEEIATFLRRFAERGYDL